MSECKTIQEYFVKRLENLKDFIETWQEQLEDSPNDSEAYCENLFQFAFSVPYLLKEGFELFRYEQPATEEERLALYDGRVALIRRFIGTLKEFEYQASQGCVVPDTGFCELFGAFGGFLNWFARTYTDENGFPIMPKDEEWRARK